MSSEEEEHAVLALDFPAVRQLVTQHLHDSLARGIAVHQFANVVALESAAPLLITAVVSIGLGFLAAGLFASAQLGYSLSPPGAEYYLIVLAGLAASLGIIASTLPVLDRITGPETARNE